MNKTKQEILEKIFFITALQLLNTKYHNEFIIFTKTTIGMVNIFFRPPY